MNAAIIRGIRARAVLAAFALAAGVYVAVATLVMMITCWDPLPFGDQWSEIITGRPVTWSWLYSQHMEHRILVPRLVFLADRYLAAETNVLDYAVNFAIPAGLAWLLFRVSRGACVPSRAWAAGVCASLLLWAGQYQNFVWGFQVQFFGVVLAAAASFAVLALARDGAWTLAYVVLLEFVSAYTLASGVLVGFLSVALAVALGKPRRVIASLALAAFVILASYLFHYERPPESSDPLGAVSHPGGVALYALVALGAPVGNLALLHAPLGLGFAISACAGLAGVYGFLRVAWAIWRARGPVQPHQGVLMTVAAFVLSMLLITATGRYVKGLESALVPRYATPAVTFWCCLVLVLAARSAVSGVLGAAAMAPACLLVLLMAITESGNVAIARDWVSARRAAAPAFLADVADLALLRRIYAVEADETLAHSAAGRWEGKLRQAHSSVFAQGWAGWLGTALSAHVAGMDGRWCDGAVDGVVRVQDSPVPGWRITGHAWDRASGAAVRRLVVTDAGGVVVGYGVGGVGGDWTGDFSGVGVVSVFALEGAEAACRVGGKNVLF